MGHSIFQDVIPLKILENMDVLWTFLLLTLRYTGMMIMLPGIGMGERGLGIRQPAIFLFALVSTLHGPYATLPTDWTPLIGQAASECLFGFLLGMIPNLMVAGIQIAGQISGTAMGMGAAQLFDPTSGIQSPTLGRIFSDVLICIFLMMGGHHAVFYVVSGLGGDIIPGTYLVQEGSIRLVIDQTAAIFTAGVMLSAPVVVALLLTQFVMGLISRAVPTVNIFIVSFPLTIGVGLILSYLTFPEIIGYVKYNFRTMEPAMAVLSADAQHPAPENTK